MGLNAEAKKSVQKVANKLGTDAKMHLKDLAGCAAPPHHVTVVPFMCSESQLTKKQVKSLGIKNNFSTTPVHDICQFNAENAVKIIQKTGSRLLTEAEWEYIARSNEDNLWLNGNLDAKEYIIQFTKTSLLSGDATFCICGLAWGSWIDDSWHNTYKGAPADGSAWEPYELPEMVRGGGAPLLYPWQTGAEAMLLLTIHREHIKEGDFPLFIAQDLPLRV
jgi:hypothetical protein